ncbi:ATP-dependent DNA helicase [Trichonephila clavipes]|nr:ATP-dependent DNA helicase [Trichonephila clavipes]
MAHILREAKLIIWDECTMAHKKGIETLNRMLQHIRGYNQIMGGITVLLSCDFRQTLPVVLRADIVKACLKTPFLWPHVNVLSLRINMRIHPQHDLRAEMLSKLLVNIGDGNIK